MTPGSGPEDEWIGVEQVSGEMHLTPRAAWEYIKRIGVRKTDDRPALARFRRSEFEAARERAMSPAAPRASRAMAKRIATPEMPKKSTPESRAANLAKFKDI